MKYPFLIIFYLLCFTVTEAYSQYLPGDPVEYYNRILQISNISDQKHSYNIRPAIDQSIVSRSHPWQHLFNSYYSENKASAGDKPYISFYEPFWFQSVNSNLPRGINDGPIWQGKGYNSSISFGAKVEYGNVRLSFRPMFGFSQNLEFDLGPYNPPFISIPRDDIREEASRFAYRDFKGRYDFVQRYGEQSFTWWDLGLSSVEVRINAFKAALSNKHIWTGPAIHSSLQFGYNAPGFQHIYLGTHEPVSTFMGSFEFAYIFGRMVSSEYFLTDKIRTQSVNSLVINYSPFFSDNFNFGAVRTFFHHYPENFSEYSKMASKLFEFLFRDSQDDWDPDNQVASVFFRYLIPQHGIEFYGEYGRNDHNSDLRDFRAQYNHARAYTLGATKVSKLTGNRLLATNFEITQTESMRAGLTRGERNIGGRLGGWYGHAHQVMGFTNRGQIIGTGYGPGFNSQIIQTDLFNPKGRIGFKLGRIVYHNSRLDQSFEEILAANEGDIENRWEVRNTELVAALHWTVFLKYNLELSGTIEQSYIFNQHNLMGNDLWNTRADLTLRLNIQGWVR